MIARPGPRTLHALLAASLLFSVAQEASAFCGFYVSGADAKLFNNATQVALVREGTRTVLSMQNNYQGPPEDFALVVPVPVVLQKDQVKTLQPESFERLDSGSAPRLVEYWEQDPCPDSKSLAGRLIPDIRFGGMYAKAAMMGGSGGAMPMVTVEAQFFVGEYDIVILGANDSLALDTWLRQNNYKIPAGAAEAFGPYIQQGMKFFVARVNVRKVRFENGQARLSPLRFHYDSEKFELPIRLGLINSPGTQDLIVHILSTEGRYEVANYPNVVVPTNIEVNEQAKEQFGAFYAALFDRVAAANPGSVVTEYAWSMAGIKCDPCPDSFPTATDFAAFGYDLPPPSSQESSQQTPQPPQQNRGFQQQPTMTRLHLRYDRSSLGQDLVFRKAEPLVGGFEPASSGRGGRWSSSWSGGSADASRFQGRYVLRHYWEGYAACGDPAWGQWGGPPGGSLPSAQSVKNVAAAPRGSVRLADLVRQDIPQIGLSGVHFEPVRRGGCVSCGVGAPAGWTGAAGALLALAALLRRRMGRGG